MFLSLSIIFEDGKAWPCCVSIFTFWLSALCSAVISKFPWNNLGHLTGLGQNDASSYRWAFKIFFEKLLELATGKWVGKRQTKKNVRYTWVGRPAWILSAGRATPRKHLKDIFVFWPNQCRFWYKICRDRRKAGRCIRKNRFWAILEFGTSHKVILLILQLINDCYWFFDF